MGAGWFLPIPEVPRSRHNITANWLPGTSAAFSGGPERIKSYFQHAPVRYAA
jgi:hypothetical protein